MSPFAGIGGTKARALHPPPDIVRHYPSLQQCVSQFLGNHGGFSGARLWRLESAAGTFCLKASNRNDVTAENLAWIHGLLAQAYRAGIEFLPQALPTASGPSVVEYGYLWDVSTWLPGAADYHEHPSAARLAAAAAALARLHIAWQGVAPRIAPCPAIRRRLDTLARWHALLASGWQPAFASYDPVRPWAERAWRLLPHRLPETEQVLSAWRNVPLTLHPCWCDPWHDHVLFIGDRVTGMIDYGNVKEDHPAVDLARLLGSFVCDDYVAWEVALAAYRAVRPLTDQECALIAVLERAGLVNAVVTWLRWLYKERRVFEDRDAVAKRLQLIVERLDNQASKIHRHGEPGS